MNPPACASCGAATQPGASACSYCGSVIADNVRVAGGEESSSAEKAIALLASNIGSLRDFPRPENGFLTILRIYVALITMGISLLFWRRPKHRFRVDEFGKLRGIIEMNMALLRARHGSNAGVTAQIDALDGEFSKIELFFKRQVMKRRLIFAATGIIILWLAVTGEMNRHDIADGLSAFVPPGETYVTHGGYSNQPRTALVTRTREGVQRVYIVDRTGGGTHRVLDTGGRALEEWNITRIRAKSDGGFEYTKHENRRWSYHTIAWDDAKKQYVKAHTR